MLKRILFFLAVVPMAYAQTTTVKPDVPTNFPLPFSTIPQNMARIETTEVIGTGAIGAVSARLGAGHNLTVTRASSTALTVGANVTTGIPGYLRFGTYTASITTSGTLTVSGSGSGIVHIYAINLATSSTSLGTVYFKASTTNPSGITLVWTACPTGVTCLLNTNPETAYPSSDAAVPLYAWSVTSGTYDSSNTASGDGGLPSDTWVDLMTFTTGGSTSTLTVQDAFGNAFLTSVSLPANSTTTFQVAGGTKFNGGISWTAGTASAITAKARYIRSATALHPNQ